MIKKMFLLAITALTACTAPDKSKKPAQSPVFIDEETIKYATEMIKQESLKNDIAFYERGIRHAASLWRQEDGTPDDFIGFVRNNFISDPEKREVIFKKISDYFESIYGYFNEITLSLKKNLDESRGEIDEIDRLFGNYSVGAHLQEDLYANKIAFIIALNFPYYTLEEKEELGPSWTREEWAKARLGDIFVSRVPAELKQALSVAAGNSDMYIADYNIHMDHLLTDDGRKIFPENMILLSHWNLRDELKADYADKTNGQEKQEMIFRVMERIIRQEIPVDVINNPDVEWAPFTNKVTKDGKLYDNADPENDTRYQHILNIFRAMKDIDPYNPEMNTAILRKFSREMEISQKEAEALFDNYLRSPQLKQVADLIKQRLGRDLRPYDIWYDGFKTRSNISEEILTALTSKLYPSPEAFQAGMPDMLKKLGWKPERAKYLASKIVVDPARGSGHAWGAARKGSVAHLRTRISENGMDYKGYNIAVHEFGHNVEQTITLYDVDYFMMSGVPNTAFTEATAFIFQQRDLMLLGMKDNNPEKERSEILDNAWSLMEIMGVGMVDMKMWKWLYENPGATTTMLKEAVINIATDTWNEYFAPVIGVKDSPLLAIYSHMVSSPLYLANYSYGQVIQFQIEEYLKDKKLADEIDRMYKQGRLTPQQWMTKAVGSKISTQPLINALEKALKSEE